MGDQDHVEGVGSLAAGYRGNGKGMKGSMDPQQNAVFTGIFHSFVTLPQVCGGREYPSHTDQ